MKWLLLLIYLPAVALADHPQGTWTGVQDGYQLRLVLSDDGTFELSADAQFPEEYRQGFAEWAEVAGTEPIETLTMIGRGRYAVDGDHVSFQIAEAEVLTNVGPFNEALLAVAQGLARVLAEQAGISEEEFVETFLADFSDEGNTLPLPRMEAWLASGGGYDKDRGVLRRRGRGVHPGGHSRAAGLLGADQGKDEMTFPKV